MLQDGWTTSSYALRQRALIDTAQSELHGLLHIKPSAAGMHVLGWLPPGSDDMEVSRRIGAANIDAGPLSAFAFRRRVPPALVLGYTGLSERVIKTAAVARPVRPR